MKKPSADAPNARSQAVIIVPGVIETMLMTDPAAGLKGRFYAPLKKNMARLMTGFVSGSLKALLFKKYDSVSKACLKLLDAAVGNLRMDPDGTPHFDLRTPVSGAKNSSYASLIKSGMWSQVWFGAQIAPELSKEAGKENVFVFTYDWRLGSPTVTEMFSAFLEEVKELTGCESVSVIGDSYGCQITASYLYTHGYDNGINRIVFDSPAWTGTALFKALMADRKEDLGFRITHGASTLFGFFLIEQDLLPIIKRFPDRIVQHVAFEFISHGFRDYLRGAAGLWCCCKTDDYEEMKEKLLDPEKNAKLIAETDKAQYGVMRHIPEVLEKAQAAGISVSVIMNEGTALFAGGDINGDGVVDAESGSGGECLRLGKTFTDGRKGKHISPSNDFDLTNAFLPDRTWVYRSLTHSQSYWDEQPRELVKKLLLTDEIKNVDTDPRFPQFSESHCPTYDVSIRLSKRGGEVLRWSEGKTNAFIRNDSIRHNIIVTGIKTEGVPYTVSGGKGRLKPGNTRKLTLTPCSTACRPGTGIIKISYIEFEYIPIPKTRTLLFTAEAE